MSRPHVGGPAACAQDAGGTWDQIGSRATGLTSEHVFTLDDVSSRGGRWLWAGTHDGLWVYHPAEEGQSAWTRLDYGETEAQAIHAFAQWEGEYHIGTWGQGVRKFAWAGNRYDQWLNWSDFGGRSPRAVSALAFLPDDLAPGTGTYYLFIGTLENGVHVLQSNSYILDEEAEDALPEAYTLYSNYPNPFNPSTEIAYTLPTAGTVRLAVFDALGREVTTFRTVPWNAPFYQQLGFVELAPAAWTPGLHARVAAETAAGLPVADRVVLMRNCMPEKPQR